MSIFRVIPPTSWGLLIITLAVVLFAFSHIERATLTCERSSEDGGECVLTTRTLTGSTVERFPVADLVEARLEQTMSKGRTRFPVHRVSLLTKSHGVLTLGTSHDRNSSGREQAYAKRINDFISDPNRAEVSIERNFWVTPTFIGLMFLAVGGIWPFIQLIRYLTVRP